MQSMNAGAPAQEGLPSTLTSRTNFFSKKSITTATDGIGPSAEHVAMQRLANDLLMATPLLLIGCFVLPTTNFIGYFKGNDGQWWERELQLDGLAFP